MGLVPDGVFAIARLDTLLFDGLALGFRAKGQACHDGTEQLSVACASNALMADHACCAALTLGLCTRATLQPSRIHEPKPKHTQAFSCSRCRRTSSAILARRASNADGEKSSGQPREGGVEASSECKAQSTAGALRSSAYVPLGTRRSWSSAATAFPRTAQEKNHRVCCLLLFTLFSRIPGLLSAINEATPTGRYAALSHSAGLGA